MATREKVISLLRSIRTSILPSELFLPGLPIGPMSSLKVDRLPLGDAAMAEARRLSSPLVVVLTPTMALARRISLPEAAKAHAEQAIKLELRQSLPAQAHGLVWSSQEMGRDKGRIEYLTYVVKETPLLRAVEDLAKFGVKVNRITVGSPEAEPVWRSKTGKDANPQVWLVLAGLLVALVSLVQILMLEQRTGELNLLIEARQARISLLEQRLSQLEASAEESVARQQALEADAAVFQLQSQRLKVLTDLGVLLPDSVWISELTVSEDRMTLAGFSRDEVSEVVSILQSAPWARTVELDGAVSFDAYSGQSRFMISVTLKPAEASP